MSNDTSTIVNRQWASRPADERFAGPAPLHALGAFARYQRDHSRAITLPNRKLSVVPSTTDPLDVAVTGPNGHPAQFSHWSFGQLCGLAGVPAGYMRSGLPGALVADCLNWSLHHQRPVEDIGVLLRKNGATTLAATTGPAYGRVWNADVVDNLISQVGDGRTGRFRVPGEFSVALREVTKENTTIYGSDRDIWCFLADEQNRVQLPNRRDGSTGTLARGFYITNSEVGSGVLGLGMFLFDYLCCNRIMWGIGDRHEIRIRHTSGAPLRWDEEVRPILSQFTRIDISPQPIEATLKAAQAQKLTKDLEDFLGSRFGRSAVMPIIAAHTAEENRPIETVWDAVTGATAYARTLTHQDSRVAIERAAGQLLQAIRV